MRSSVLHCNFNPRSREGSDVFARNQSTILLRFQSTLPRGERLYTCTSKTETVQFQSTLPRGERRKGYCIIHLIWKFQSTLPRGERRTLSKSVKRVIGYFNPRSREGSDIMTQSTFGKREISIHAPARGATVLTTLMLIQTLFQSTLPRGERLKVHEGDADATDFNPRSREGSDDYDTVNFWQARDFNPRSREGSDRKYTQTTNIISVYFYLYYIIFVSLATNTAYITITKPSKCRCESPYTFC